MVYLFLLAHLVADFMFQPYWLVVRKQRWDGLLLHGTIVLVCMVALGVIDQRVLHLWPAMLVITIIHIITDWGKVRYGDRIPGPPIIPFLLDQIIHGSALIATLTLMMPADQVWSQTSSPIAPLAIIAAVYVIAAFATPIGVMVWLDPTAKHAALSGGARIRSLCAGALVLSLTLLTGIVALPATLVGLTVATRYPSSAHPLDTPNGLLVVLSVAAALGTALALFQYHS